MLYTRYDVQTFVAESIKHEYISLVEWELFSHGYQKCLTMSPRLRGCVENRVLSAVASGVPLCISYAGLLQLEDLIAGKARELLEGQAFYPSSGVRAMPGGKYARVEILH